MSFKVIKKDRKNQARLGRIYTKHGVIRTPVFMPIATSGAVKNLTSEELLKLGAEIVLANTYHLWLRPGIKIIKKTGGLHQFMNWPGPILTDSGGFQAFSLSRHCQITDEGVEFSDPDDGKKHFLSPEKSIQIQLDLGSDIILVLDECPGYPCTKKEAAKAVERTTLWAKRCKEYFTKHVTYNAEQKRPILFGIIQGSIYKDLRQKNAREILEIGFDGYAIGGVAVGEPRKYIWKVLDWLVPFLPEDKPRHLLGLGRPEEIIEAVRRGIDMFDCVIPTREARHGRLYIYSSTKSARGRTRGEVLDSPALSWRFRKGVVARTIKSGFYETIQITNSKFKKDLAPIDKNCDCYTCQHYSRAYLNHLFKLREPLGLRLATVHNLRFYLELMEGLRNF